MPGPKKVCDIDNRVNINSVYTHIAEGDFEGAAKGYQKAKDYENLVRIYVEHLHRINEASVFSLSTASHYNYNRQ